MFRTSALEVPGRFTPPLGQAAHTNLARASPRPAKLVRGSARHGRADLPYS